MYDFKKINARSPVASLNNDIKSNFRSKAPSIEKNKDVKEWLNWNFSNL